MALKSRAAVEGSLTWKVVLAVHAEREDTWWFRGVRLIFGGEDGGGAVALVNVEVDDEDPLDSLGSDQYLGGHRQIVPNAEAAAKVPVAVVCAPSAGESDPGVETKLGGEDGARDLAEGRTDEHLAPREPDPPELALVQLSPHEIRDVPLRVHEPKLLDEVRLADFRSKDVGAGGETHVDEAVVNPSEDHHGKLARREASVLSESRKCVVLSSNT